MTVAGTLAIGILCILPITGMLCLSDTFLVLGKLKIGIRTINLKHSS